MKKICLFLLMFLTFGIFAQETAPVQTEETTAADANADAPVATDTAADDTAADDTAADDTAAAASSEDNAAASDEEASESTNYTDRSAQVDVSKVGTDQQASEVKAFVLDQFNLTTGWEPVVYPDTATAVMKYLDRPDKPESEGEKYDLTGNTAEAEERSTVLGAKINFTRRAYGEEFYLKRSSPIRLEGITKAFSLWVCGRGMNHELYIRAKSATGMIVDIPFENPKLNFIGWKQLVAYVPPTVIQEDSLDPDNPGLTVLGLVLKFNAMEMVYDYYIYFDDLEAYTDVVHLSQYSGIENMSDEW